MSSKYIKYLIDPEKLNLNDFKAERFKLMSIHSGREKIEFISEFIQNEIPLKDIFSNNFSINPINDAEDPNDLLQFYLIYMLCIFRNNFMKKIFPKNDLKYNKLDSTEREQLLMPKKLFQIFFSLIFTTKSFLIQYTSIELLLAYSEYCENFADYCIDDDFRYINKIIQLTYSCNEEIIECCIIILENIINDDACDKECVERILDSTQIIQRCQEIIYNNISNINIQENTLELLFSLCKNIHKAKYDKYFGNFMPIFLKLLQEYGVNNKILTNFLEIASKITNSDNICKQFITVGIGEGLFELLCMNNINKRNLILTIQTFSNLFYLNEIIIFFISKKPNNIIDKLISLIKTYMNTSNSDDIEILVEILFCASNLATGPKEAIIAIVKSELPDLILQIMKIKKNNKIYFEALNFFYNMIYESTTETFGDMLKYNPIKLFGQGLEKTNYIDNILICLKGIILVYEKNCNIYNNDDNLRNDFISCMIKRKLNDLVYHKNNDISEYSRKILNLFDNSMNTD